MDLIQRLRAAARLFPTADLGNLLGEAANELAEIRALIPASAVATDTERSTAQVVRDHLVASWS